MTRKFLLRYQDFALSRKSFNLGDNFSGFAKAPNILIPMTTKPRAIASNFTRDNRF
jgi:hypothetical protein